jgi:hypothetical protein
MGTTNTPLLQRGTTGFVDYYAVPGANFYEVVTANSWRLTWATPYATAIL